MSSKLDDQNKAFDNIIESRRTIRRFRPEIPPRAMVDDILRAGLLAPFAQISITREDFRRFVVIPRESPATEKAALMIKRRTARVLEELEGRVGLDPRLRAKAERYMGVLRLATQQGPPNLGKAAYYIVVGEQKGIPEIAELSLAHCLENMWLKATVLGLGFQLLSVTEHMAEDEDFCELLGIEFGEFALDGCLVGYPEGAPPPPMRPSLTDVTTWL